MEQNQSVFDRRTLVAFVLMFAVWFGWMVIFPPDKPVVEEEIPTEELSSLEDTERLQLEPVANGSTPATSVETSATSEGAPAESTPLTQSGWVNEAPTENGEVVVVSTPLFEARFDAVGADLLSWQLREYDLDDGAPVDLVNTRTSDLGTQSAHALRVLFEGQALDLRRVRFDVNRQSLALADGDSPTSITFSAERHNGGSIRLEYTFDPTRYGFEVTASLMGDTGQPLPTGLDVRWPGGIAASEPDSVTEYREFRSVAKVGEDIHKIKYDKVTGNDSDAHQNWSGSVAWAGAQSKYFLAAVVDHAPRAGRVSLSGDNNTGVQTFQADLGAVGQSPAQVTYEVYLGPVDYEQLKVYNSDLGKLVDMGFSFIRPVSKLTLIALNWMHNYIPNWGWTIIIFSVITKLLFWPLTKSSTESMKRMQELQPKLQAMREKYKDDQQKQTEEMMRLYKENKVNPVGGCLPLLVQSPFFFALFSILRKNVALRQADFALWIDDLSVPDVLFELPFSLPVLGNHVSVLPILMALAMWAQTKMSTTSNSSSGQPENAMANQMKMMTTLMPVMMFFVFYNSPSGLVLYWFVNTILTAAQTWRVNASKPKTAEA